jgi:hypothetical protein
MDRGVSDPGDMKMVITEELDVAAVAIDVTGTDRVFFAATSSPMARQAASELELRTGPRRDKIGAIFKSQHP